MTDRDRQAVALCRYGNAAILVFIALFFFLLPGATVVCELGDANLRSPGIPRTAWRMHRSLSPRFERWAVDRVNSTRGAELSINNISGTEWPLFGSVFYLWATESLQEAWEKDH